MSQTTKRALAASLKKLLSQKTLDKITVADVAEDCQVNRQTFYYHFKDIYDLIEWTYLDETSKLLEGRKSYGTWQEGYLSLLGFLNENKAFVLNSFRSVSREHLERFLQDGVFTLLFAVVEEISRNLSVREEDKRFIARFFTYGFVGLTIEWIGSGMKQPPAELAEHLSRTVSGDFMNALERCRTDKPGAGAPSPANDF